MSSKRLEDLIRPQRLNSFTSSLAAPARSDRPFSASRSGTSSPNAVKEPAPKTPPSRHASLSSLMQQGVKIPLVSRGTSSERWTCEDGTIATVYEPSCRSNVSAWAIEDNRDLETRPTSNVEAETPSSLRSDTSMCGYAVNHAPHAPARGPAHRTQFDAGTGRVPDYLSMWMFGAGLISSLLLATYLAYLATHSG